jgi:hypothetical protein
MKAPTEDLKPKKITLVRYIKQVLPSIDQFIEA